jgi:insertion element IS1 protein InsB
LPAAQEWATAQEPGASADTVIKELKKEKQTEYVNKEYLESHKNIAIHIETDEMRSFYHDKKHQIRLWRAIGHETGKAAAFWFGTREHGNLDKLPELLKPGKVYTGGNYAYCERFAPEVLAVTKKNTQKTERKHLSLRTWSARLARKGLRFSKTKQNRCTRLMSPLL